MDFIYFPLRIRKIGVIKGVVNLDSGKAGNVVTAFYTVSFPHENYK